MPNTTSEVIRRTIGVELVRRGMNQRGLASRIQKSDAWVSTRMTGTAGIDLADLDLIASGLGLTAFELIESARREAQPQKASA